ncbi:related to pyridine nucleotide-disulphide oxidoreductase AMID-like [Phialocephala subalpina]|uniref:Related to pyridine nucleotide-disulphide oxidoreductase AMID-like n=1 Tax=Phialocephala subalpina TaxID=576137 RepID=A0A1L7XUW4_9HELO|nr:related to pyridine nucleotide-disulphide oxidoreductase AMID-like [Phialocephala subalpina]
MTLADSLHIILRMGSIEEDFAVKETPTKVLVLGGCYGGLSAALNLRDLCDGKRSRATLHLPDEGTGKRAKLPVEIKIVDERDGYYHLIGSPLALAYEDFAQKAWVKYDDLPALKAPGVSWVQARATSVDPEMKVAIITNTLSGETTEESYDYLIVSTGLRRDWPTVPQSLRRKEYLAEATAHIRAARSARECVVIGGGAVGIEMAAELKLVEPSLDVKLIHSRDRFLSSEPLPDEFKDRTAAVLREGGVDLILSRRVNEIIPINKEDEKPLFDLTLSDGSVLKAGHVISAISHGIPSTSFLPPSSLNEHGYVNISSTLNFKSTAPNHLSHFAVGDIANWSGIKRCGAAMAMGHIAATNVYQQLLQKKFGSEPKFAEFPEVPPMIALAVGKQAVLYGEKEGTTWGEDKMDMMFGSDLGWSICWNYLRLGYDGTTGELVK